MLKSLRVENFKAFGDIQEIPLAPITLIYGPNSAGKSSLIQSILLFHQTVQNAPLNSSRILFSGEDVDLGTFTSALYRHDTNKEMRFGFSFFPARSRRIHYPHTGLSRNLARSVDISMDLTDSARKEKHHEAWVSSAIYGYEGKSIALSRIHSDEERPVEDSSAVGEFHIEDDRSSLDLLELLRVVEKVRRDIERVDDSSKDSDAPNKKVVINAIKKVKFLSLGLLPSRIDFNDRNIERLSNLGLRFLASQMNPLEVIRREFYEELQSVSYLGPLRSHPTRHYIISGADKNSVGSKGERTPQLMWRRKKDVVPRINQKFADFGIPYAIDIKSAGNLLTGDIVVVQLSDKNDVVVSPSDVGFGIGQLLPILVEGVVSAERIICVEQPEIHLHPRLQGHIADFLIDTAKSHGDPAKAGRSTSVKEYGGNQWIVETHSEALIMRLQTRVKEGLPPDFVSVLYVEPKESGGARVRRLRLDQEGDFIDEWPDGFFEESFKEIFARRRK
jgi:hypothetical protein